MAPAAVADLVALSRAHCGSVYASSRSRDCGRCARVCVCYVLAGSGDLATWLTALEVGITHGVYVE